MTNDRNNQNNRYAHSKSRAEKKSVFSSNVILLGLPGAGKTTVGTALARILGLGFCDLDVWITESVEKTVEQIFSEEGEEAFRDLENKAIQNLSEFSNYVLAVGGGCVEASGNIDILKRFGVCVWLNVDPKVIAKRLAQHPLSLGKRPILANNLSKDNPLNIRQDLEETLIKLLEKRAQYYNKAHIVFKENYADYYRLANLLKLKLIRYKKDRFQ